MASMWCYDFWSIINPNCSHWLRLMYIDIWGTNLRKAKACHPMHMFSILELTFWSLYVMPTNGQSNNVAFNRNNNMKDMNIQVSNWTYMTNCLSWTNQSKKPWERYLSLWACSFGWWLMAGADLYWEKSTTGWLLVCSERKVLLAGGW
jgi:hypothetical protein